MEQEEGSAAPGKKKGPGAPGAKKPGLGGSGAQKSATGAAADGGDLTDN